MRASSSLSLFCRVPLGLAAASAFACAGLLLAIGPVPAAAADTGDEAAEVSTADTELSDRQRRREERRQQRQERRANKDNSDQSHAANAGDGDREYVVVLVEPEVECRTERVVGSRVPRQICTPVAQQRRDEEKAQEFLRRTRQNSTITPPPSGDGIGRSGLPGFQ